MTATETALHPETFSDVVPLFLDLVSIASPSGHESAVADYVQSFLAENQLDSQRDEHGNVLVQVPGEGEAVFMNAHLDTVQQIGENVTPIVDDGWVKSDGTTILGSDNKASVAALLSMLKFLSQNQDLATTHRPLEVVFTTSEETGNYGAIGFDKSLLTATEGYIFDAALPLGTIITASPYYARFDVEIQGTAAHAARRAESTPAVPIMLSLLSQIEQMRADDLLVNIGKIQGGTARNTVVGEIKFGGEIRSFYEKTFSTALLRLERLLASEYPAPVDSKIVVENPGYFFPDAIVKPVQEKISRILGTPVQAQTSYGVSDGNLFVSDTLKVFTLGDGGLDPHTVTERIHVDTLKNLAYLAFQLGRP